MVRGVYTIMMHVRRTHEDDVAEPLALLLGQVPREEQRLLEDLAVRELPREALLARRAEGAGHGTPRLRADAGGAPPVLVGHEHTLNQRVVLQEAVRALDRPVAAALLEGHLEAGRWGGRGLVGFGSV